MNLYNTNRPDLAEAILAMKWAEDAKAERKRWRMVNGSEINMPARQQAARKSNRGNYRKVGVLPRLREFAKTRDTFTLADARQELTEFTPKQVVSSIHSGLEGGSIIAVGKTAMGANIYRGTGQ